MSSSGDSLAGYGMDYDEAKALAEFAAMKNEVVEEEESIDSHPSENEWLIPQWNAFLKTAEEEDKKKEDKKEEEEEVADVIKECRFCGKAPCVVDFKFYNEMVAEAEELYEEAGPNKHKRFALYAFAAKKLFGYLGPGVRKMIPHCVTSEIHDLFPENIPSNYVGFKEAAEN
jgi:hypothetical protein